MSSCKVARLERREVLVLGSNLIAAVLAGCSGAAGPSATQSTSSPSASGAADGRRLIEDARETLAEFKADPRNLTIREMLSRARAVVVFPRLLKGGFIVGVEGGRGVMFARRPGSRAWSEPVFMGMANASLGLQAGVQSAETVLVVYSDAALEKLLTDKVKLGADVSVAVISAGGGAERATGTGFTGDIAVISRAQGLYGGVSVEGGVVAPDDDVNRAYYGRPISPRETIAIGGTPSPSVKAMHDTLG